MNKIYLQSLTLIIALLISSFSYAQKKTNTPKTFKQEMAEVEVGFYKSEAIKKIGTALTRGAMDKSNREAASKATQQLWRYSKDMSKDQMEKFIARLSKMSTAGINQLKKMSPRQLNSFVADAAGKLSKNTGVLKQIIAGAGDKAGNTALLAISKIDDIMANNGTVPKALFAKLKDAASKLPPEKAKAYLDLIKKKFTSDWADIVNLEDATKGPAQVIGKVVDGIFVLNDAYDIYYSDDEPEVKAIKASSKMIDYGVSTAAGEAAFELGAANLGLGASLGVGLTIAFTANRVSTLYTEIMMLQQEREAAKDAEQDERINNEILVRRQFVNINNKIKSGQINNANLLLNKLHHFLIDHNFENEQLLLNYHTELEEKAKMAERNQRINEVINTARRPYKKALTFHIKGVELHLAKIYAAEALTILNTNLKTYPEIGSLNAISNTEQLINAINEKITNAADLIITGTNIPIRVYTGQSIEIKVFVNGGIPYYRATGNISGNISDEKMVTMYWEAPSEPGIEHLTFTIRDCMGSIASVSASTEVVERPEEIEEAREESIEEITDNSPKGLEGCWVGWTVCGTRDINCPIFQYFFKIQSKSELKYYAIQAQVQIINGKYSITCDDGFADDRIRKKKIIGEGWKLTKFKYPDIPELSETSNKKYNSQIQDLSQELKEAKNADERFALQLEIDGINDRIKKKAWSRIFYKTALAWTNKHKWEEFVYSTDEDEYYNGYNDWWVCPDEVLAAFEHALKSKSN